MEDKLIQYFSKEYRKAYGSKGRHAYSSSTGLDVTQVIFSDIKYRGSEVHRDHEEMKLDGK